jgi:hypothetical protein
LSKNWLLPGRDSSLSLDGCRQIPFIDDGLLAVQTLVGIASLNLQGCITLTDSGLAALGHMVSLTSCNLQDCAEITGGCPATVSPALSHHVAVTASLVTA